MVVSWLFASWAVAFSPSSTFPLQISRGGLTTLNAGPPVPPKPVGIYMHGVSKPTLVIETYLDFCCPFSRKMFDCLYGDVMPPLMAAGQVDWLFQCVPQPWHPQSSYMHEVALAVKLVDESKFMPAASALFAAQSQFYDTATADKTRNQIYDNLVAVVAAAVPGLDSEAVRSLVALKGTGNDGNRVTQVI